MSCRCVPGCVVWDLADLLLWTLGFNSLGKWSGVYPLITYVLFIKRYRVDELDGGRKINGVTLIDGDEKW